MTFKYWSALHVESLERYRFYAHEGYPHSFSSRTLFFLYSIFLMSIFLMDCLLTARSGPNKLWYLLSQNCSIMVKYPWKHFTCNRSGWLNNLRNTFLLFFSLFFLYILRIRIFWNLLYRVASWLYPSLQKQEFDSVGFTTFLFILSTTPHELSNGIWAIFKKWT